MICSLDGRDVSETLDGLVGEDWKRAALGYPGIVVNPFLRHRLLDHHNAVLLKPIYLVQCHGPVFPALVGIHCNRQVCYFADGADHLLVIVKTDLDLQDIEAVGTFTGLLTDHVRLIDAYCKCRIRCLGRVQTPDSVPWGA